MGELIYHTKIEVRRLSVRKGSNNESCKPWAMRLVLPPAGDLEFSPSIFAAEALEQREQWLQAFGNFTYFVQTTQTTRGSQAVAPRTSVLHAKALVHENPVPGKLRG